MTKKIRIKESSAILLSVLLLSMGFSGNSESFAITPQAQIQEIIDELKLLEQNSETSKKSKKKISNAIHKLERSLNEKFWKDESSLKYKNGIKVVNLDINAISKLDKVLKDKKTSKEVKDQVFQINLRITEINKNLLENTIGNLSELIMGEKGLKKIEKATSNLEKGNEFLENEDYTKALKKFKKAWEQVKKSLKDPHFKQLKLIHLEGTDDLDNDDDELQDIYIKILKPKKQGNPYKVELKITQECVKGNTYDLAGMKIGFSTQERFSDVSFHEEFHMTNDWFLTNDPDQEIDPVIIEERKTWWGGYPDTGDDFIQTNEVTGESSFTLNPEPLSILDNQMGWEGDFEFTGPPGDYYMAFWMPDTIGGSEFLCNFLGSFPIPTTVE
ncbi:hypothetical protein [Nitrosopumilus sp.]|uniref:hypothetical protein n=1 Tax=Nitrosopumilus sp. TaxID=2024843 RepID=UPI00261E64E4|nr:hypothetical protein [Nitrosopumilus sp.]